MLKGRRDDKQKKKPSSTKHQLGLFNIPGIDALEDSDMDGDEDVEAELMSLINPSPGSNKKAASKPKLPKLENLDAMVVASLRDIPSDEELSGDEDELLAEIAILSGEQEAPPASVPSSSTETPSSDIQSVLVERLNMYKEAEANAKAVGDTAKSRRLGRGLKTLNELLKKAQKGGVIDESEIPVVVASGAKKSPTEAPLPRSNEDTLPEAATTPAVRRTAPPPPVSPKIGVPLPGLTDLTATTSDAEPQESPEMLNSNKLNTIAVLTERRDEYKKAALIAKRAGDTQTAVAHVKVVRQFELVIAGVEAGQPVDLNTMPGAPILTDTGTKAPPAVSRQGQSESQHASPPEEQPSSVQSIRPPQGTEETAEPVMAEPKTVLEALEQRMAKYQEQEEAGKRDGNASKSRRMGRIVKQYQDAIKLHKAGKPFPVEELPTPPGFPPIPVEGAGKPEGVGASAVVTPSPSVVNPSLPGPSSALLSPTLPRPQPPSPTPSRSPVPVKRSPVPSTSTVKGSVTRQEKQLSVLLARQKQFKAAAIEAKQKGNISLAKEYLRTAKGFDPLIEASKSGLPIEMNTIPIPPTASEKLDSEFEVVMLKDCLEGTDSEIYEQLISDLQHQFKMSMETRTHFKNIGDVGSANKFEHLALNTKKDLDTVKTYRSRNDPVPRFHYEKKSFSIVKCNVDLTDNDLELTIVQGVNYNVPNPKEVDTYVRYEFPCPNDEIKRDKTSTVYNTNNPKYEAVFVIPIQRSVRAFQRVFKRHSIKCEVWSKGGFLRSDSLIGTALVKLQALETKCAIHDSFDLMDGRKAVGGKLEVKVRVRDPIQTKQIEHVDEKWLIIG